MFLRTNAPGFNENREMTVMNELSDRGGQMSFLEHLDELRKRLVNIVVIVVVAFVFCWFVSGYIFNFLSVPIKEALSEAERRQLPVVGLTGNEQVLSLASLKEGDRGRYVFDRATTVGGPFGHRVVMTATALPPGGPLVGGSG